MKAKAVVMTLTVHIDLEEVTPDLDLKVDIESGFRFLADNKPVMANWLRKAADDLQASL